MEKGTHTRSRSHRAGGPCLTGGIDTSMSAYHALLPKKPSHLATCVHQLSFLPDRLSARLYNSQPGGRGGLRGAGCWAFSLSRDCEAAEGGCFKTAHPAAAATCPVIPVPQPSSLDTPSYVPQETVITAVQHSAQGQAKRRRAAGHATAAVSERQLEALTCSHVSLAAAATRPVVPDSGSPQFSAVMRECH
jgi:hypothetical protein